jgi:hypothetical protein
MIAQQLIALRSGNLMGTANGAISAAYYRRGKVHGPRCRTATPSCPLPTPMPCVASLIDVNGILYGTTLAGGLAITITVTEPFFSKAIMPHSRSGIIIEVQ